MVKLLFLCTHNACRSILAEVIARKLGGSRLTVVSAGSAPAGRIHPLTLAFLTQQGYSTNGLRSQSLEEFQDFHPDAVITVCDSAAGEACPLWLGDSLRVHWGLPDPSHAPEAERDQLFMQVATILQTRIRGLLDADFEKLDPAGLKTLMEKLGAQQ